MGALQLLHPLYNFPLRTLPRQNVMGGLKTSRWRLTLS